MEDFVINKYQMGKVREANGVAGGAAIRVVARRSIDVVLINVAKLLIHGVAI